MRANNSVLDLAHMRLKAIEHRVGCRPRHGETEIVACLDEADQSLPCLVFLEELHIVALRLPELIL